MKTSVLIACSPISDGQELFMDYRLRPSADGKPLPSWYAIYDNREVQRKWS